MKRKIFTLLSLGVACFMLSACAKDKGENKEARTDNVIEYSNLNSKESQKEISDLLKQSGIKQDSIDNFLQHVNQFNDIAQGQDLLGEFTAKDPASAIYDVNTLSDNWTKKYPDFIGYNCRITSYSLYKDFVKVDSSPEIRDELLFMDLEALDTDNSAVGTPEGMNKFEALYSSILTEKSPDTKIHIANIEKSLKDRNITFTSNDKASMISVWMYDDIDEAKLFVGHIGVLLNTDKGLYFIEKLSFQEPYQVIKFNTKKEVNDYLMKKYDVDPSEERANPIIFENASPIQV